MQDQSCLCQRVGSRSKPLIPRHGILTVISALATIITIAADIRETRATTDSPFPELRRSNHNLLAPLPTAAPARPLIRAAAPIPGVGSRTITASVTGRTRTRVRPLRGNATSQTRSGKPPKTGTQPPPQPAPAAKAPEPTPTPAPSACQLRLTPDVALVRPLPSITGPGSCGAEDVVRLEAVVLKDGQRVALAPAATLRCPMAEAVARWIREEVAPAAATLGSSARTIVTATSYDCRERDRVPGAKLSEHGRANALDLRGVTLANGTAVDLTDKAASKEFRELIRQSACNAFTTVLGPGSDDYHNSHIHLDLIERKGGYRMCQWDVLTMPEVGGGVSPEDPHPSNGAK
jgi:hypothetical protein